MFLYGGDFHYADQDSAEIQFSLMDDIIKYVNESYENIEAAYSTPSQYFHEVLSDEVNFNYFQGDFFPYSVETELSDGLAYYTGYYSTRPELKRRIKAALTLNRAANIISGLACDDHYNDPDVSLLIHHSALAGTVTPPVITAYD
jgi:hypothetical protein